MINQQKRKLLRSLIVLPCFLCASGFLFLDKQSATAMVSADAPIIWSISDAVKPNETVTITGHSLHGEDLTVAYAPNLGKEPEIFNEQDEPLNCTYLNKSALTAVDTENGSGLMFILPNSKPCGMYDVWVKANGVWSDGVTLNATRPLYLNQEASYSGLPIEIVGRNFFQSEYGIGTEEMSLASLKVKLVRVSDINGTIDGITEETTIGVESSVRYTTSDSVTGETIVDSNPYKITFLTPTVSNVGTYKVLVASDGIDFRELQENQQLIIYSEKVQSWDESVFGQIANNTHIGNDPLDLKSYWAQDLNYNNIETILPNETTDTTLGTKIAQAAYRLSQKGGGVVYFPEGDYYLTHCSSFYENVIWVGAGADKTKIHYSVENTGGGSWIKANGVSNIGFARMTFTQANPNLKVYPDAILNLADTAGVTSDGAVDVSLQGSKNKFVTDVVIDFPYDTINADGETIENQRRFCSFAGAKNFVFQNVLYEGSNFPMNCSVYEYVNIRNAKLYSNDSNDFMSVMSNYTFLENVLFEKDWNGHGISLRNNASVSNCYVAKVGDPNWVGNIGEALVFEPSPGFYSVGTIADATDRTFTVNMHAGTEITNAAPKLACNNFAIQIVGGKGGGQIRYFKRSPVSKNCYELLDGEKAWDVIPDETSRYTIIIPMKNATIYRFKAENCVKGIYLYSQMFDTVVAECDLKNTEGVLLYSVSIPVNGRINPNANVRIVNNRIEGVSPGSNKGGINIRYDSVGDSTINGFGTLIQGVEIKGNSLFNTTPIDNHTGISATEQSVRCGIVIDYVSGYDAKTDSKLDVKFVTVENNVLTDSQYGIYYEMASTGAVIRNNVIKETKFSFSVVEPRIECAHIVDGIDVIDENETERFPIDLGGSGSDSPGDSDSATEELPDEDGSGSVAPDNSDDLGKEDSSNSSSSDQDSSNETEKIPIGGDSSDGGSSNEGSSDVDNSLDGNERPTDTESPNNSANSDTVSTQNTKSGCFGSVSNVSWIVLIGLILMAFVKINKEQKNNLQTVKEDCNEKE